MEMKNVLDQLRLIAETNDSEDVARAIGTVSSHQRVAEAGQFTGPEDHDFLRKSNQHRSAHHEITGDELTNVEVEGVDSSDYPDFVDAFVTHAEWKNTGRPLNDEELERIDPAVAQEAAMEDMIGAGDAYRDAQRDSMFDSAKSFKDRLKEAEGSSQDREVPDDVQMSDGQEKVDEEPANDTEYCATCANTGMKLDAENEPCPNCSDDEPADSSDNDPHGIGDEGGAVEAWNRISDRVDSRAGGEDEIGGELGDDPWGIGDEQLNASAQKDAAGRIPPDDTQASDGHSPGGALDRVRDRSNRSGSGGPIERVQLKASDRNGAVEEDINMSFNTPMERHQWLMQELSSAASQMDPESAQVVKSIINKAGQADVKGGNC